MGNDTKSLLISGAVCIVVLIISIGMFIYNNSASSTYEGISKFSEQEVNTFNSKFTIYEGIQDGTKVKNLIAILVSNSTIYDDEEYARLPQLLVSNNSELIKLGIKDATRPSSENEKTEYIQKLTKIRNSLNTRKSYLIEMEFSSSGIIDKINILDSNESV